MVASFPSCKKTGTGEKGGGAIIFLNVLVQHLQLIFKSLKSLNFSFKTFPKTDFFSKLCFAKLKRIRQRHTHKWHYSAAFLLLEQENQFKFYLACFPSFFAVLQYYSFLLSQTCLYEPKFLRPSLTPPPIVCCKWFLKLMSIDKLFRSCRTWDVFAQTLNLKLPSIVFVFGNELRHAHKTGNRIHAMC